jgi:hypothetical protein
MPDLQTISLNTPASPAGDQARIFLQQDNTIAMASVAVGVVGTRGPVPALPQTYSNPLSPVFALPSGCKLVCRDAVTGRVTITTFGQAGEVVDHYRAPAAG